MFCFPVKANHSAKFSIECFITLLKFEDTGGLKLNNNKMIDATSISENILSNFKQTSPIVNAVLVLQYWPHQLSFDCWSEQAPTTFKYLTFSSWLNLKILNHQGYFLLISGDYLWKISIYNISMKILLT